MLKMHENIKKKHTQAKVKRAWQEALEHEQKEFEAKEKELAVWLAAQKICKKVWGLHKEELMAEMEKPGRSGKDGRGMASQQEGNGQGQNWVG